MNRRTVTVAFNFFNNGISRLLKTLYHSEQMNIVTAAVKYLTTHTNKYCSF